MALDGGDIASVRAAIGEVVRQFGRIDILVNNAGSAGPKQPIENLPLLAEELAALRKKGSTDGETVPQALRNIFGVAFNVARVAAEHIPEGGSIINVSTIFSRTPYYARAAYVVPKAAMNAWSRELSLELGPRGITCNPVAPGCTRTEMIAGQTWPDRVPPWTALRRLGEPEDIADVVAFLASDEARWLTGLTIAATGGLVTTAANILARAG